MGSSLTESPLRRSQRKKTSAKRSRVLDDDDDEVNKDSTPVEDAPMGSSLTESPLRRSQRKKTSAKRSRVLDDDDDEVNKDSTPVEDAPMGSSLTESPLRRSQRKKTSAKRSRVLDDDDDEVNKDSTPVEDAPMGSSLTESPLRRSQRKKTSAKRSRVLDDDDDEVNKDSTPVEDAPMGSSLTESPLRRSQRKKTSAKRSRVLDDDDDEVNKDVLGNILKKSTAKRSRARVVDKLISMGLVSERRQPYNTRSSSVALRKSSGKSSRKSSGKSSRKSSGKDMTEEEFLSDLMGQLRGRESTVAKMPIVGTMLCALQQEGLSGPLLWLQNCLNKTADTREEDGLSQPVPLAPFTEENEDAMEKRSFQKLLRKLGLRAPANEQESFWRIPEKLSPAQLRAAAVALTLRKELPAGGKEPPAPGSPNQEHQYEYEKRSEALRALMHARKRKRRSDKPNEVIRPTAMDNDGDSDSETVWAPSKRCRQAVFIDDDDDDD
ncbi:hypothetical protein NHX12_031146 [Muraenolepis orangiensis]|uniref:Timeless C-terminal domain-containing protein n=1 Tax=Muraenolepis orangiensis TaxID=630683 RepID=A0A9Q0EBA1_9TELE|nr:hypothetical protein NHX12_031146 [Muraenolepis orangiensis]